MNACLPAPASSMPDPPGPAAPRPHAATWLTVLQVRSSAGLYGADRVLLALNPALARCGARSRLLSIHNYRMREQPLHAAALASAQEADLLPCRGRFDPRTVRALNARIDAVDTPLLHAHDYKSAFYAWLAARRRRVPLVATLHGQAGSSHSLRLYNRLELALLRRFDALVVVADAQIPALVRAGIARSRIHQVDNGIDFAPAATDAIPGLRSALGLGPARFVFGAVARLAPEKNLSMLLDVFARLACVAPGIALVVAGDGPERAALEARARALGLGSCVHFIGARTDMAPIYTLFDCLVLPSLSEGMPLAVLEAMACALPVVASAVGDVPRLLAHAAHGRLVAPGDAQALRAAMHAAMADPGRRDQSARNYVLDRHSAKAMAVRYLEIYRSLPVHDHANTTA